MEASQNNSVKQLVQPQSSEHLGSPEDSVTVFMLKPFDLQHFVGYQVDVRV